MGYLTKIIEQPKIKDEQGLIALYKENGLEDYLQHGAYGLVGFQWWNWEQHFYSNEWAIKLLPFVEDGDLTFQGQEGEYFGWRFEKGKLFCLKGEVVYKITSIILTNMEPKYKVGDKVYFAANHGIAAGIISEINEIKPGFEWSVSFETFNDEVGMEYLYDSPFDVLKMVFESAKTDAKEFANWLLNKSNNND